MKVIKEFLNYSIWIILSLVLGILYIRLIIREIPNEDDYRGLGFFLNVFYNYGIFYLGLIVGGIIALLFIVTDVFLLKKRLSNNLQSNLVKSTVLVLIAFIVFIFHYFLEKVIDVI